MPDPSTDLVNEKIKRLDDKIDQTERYLAERCIRIEGQISATEKLLALAQNSAKEAVTKAEDASKIRFESFNEFNTRMAEMTATFATIAAFEEFKKSMEQRLREMSARMDRGEGTEIGGKSVKDESRSNLALLVSALAFLAMLILTLFKKGT